MRITKLGTGKYQVRYRDKTRAQRAKNFRTKELAQDFCRAVDRDDATRQSPPTLEFKAFAERWLADPTNGRAPRTLQEDRSKLALHILPEIGSRPLSAVRRADLLAVMTSVKKKIGRRGKPIDNQTVNQIVRTAKAVMRSAAEWELVAANPFQTVRELPESAKPADSWTIDEREKFLNYCRTADPDFAELVTVACHTGLRLGELAALQRHQIDFAQRMIRVDASYSNKTRQREPFTKNRKVRHVPMNDETMKALKSRRLMASEAPVFDQGLFADYYDRLQRRAKSAAVRPIRFHDLRHTFCSTLIRAGAGGDAAQTMLGHQSRTMTDRYRHLEPGFLLEACASIVHSSKKRRVSR